MTIFCMAACQMTLHMLCSFCSVTRKKKRLLTVARLCSSVTNCRACRKKSFDVSFLPPQKCHILQRLPAPGHIEVSLQTVATLLNCCGRLRTVARGCDWQGNILSTHASTPRAPKLNKNTSPFGKRWKSKTHTCKCCARLPTRFLPARGSSERF